MDSNVHVDLWKLSQSDFEAGWELGQVLIESETRYKLVAKVVRGSAGNGWAGLDDFEFYHDQVDCPTLPENAKPPPPPTTEPPPGLYFQFTNFWEGFLILESRWVFFCSSNIDFYSLICKYYCSIFHSHTASVHREDTMR